VLFELALTFQVRSETRHVFSQGWEALTSNPSLLVAVVASFLLQMGALYFPILSGVLRMVPLSLEQLGLTFAAAGSALLIVPRLFIKPLKVRKS
jgi:magnesium-transporting ATPase (P-type)